MKVKICGITNMEDALAAVEAGADALGFNLYRKSPRYIEPQEAQRIIDSLPSEVMSVGVFVNEPEPEDVASTADRLALGAVQLHGDESPDYCRALRDRYVIKALHVDEDFDPDIVEEYQTEAILIDASVTGLRGGTGQIVDWEIARAVAERVSRLFLAGGLSTENVAEAISAVGPYAVDACSRLEITPGKKDLEKMRSFVAAARLVR